MKLYNIFEEIINDVNYIISYDEDRTEIKAKIKGSDVGYVVSDILYDSYSYEFEGICTEDEFDELFPDDTIVKIENIRIIDGYKEQGIAKELMTRILSLMKEKGYKQFYLNASPMGFGGLNVKNLVKFYEKFGFKILLNQGNNVLMFLIIK